MDYEDYYSDSDMDEGGASGTSGRGDFDDDDYDDDDVYEVTPIGVSGRGGSDDDDDDVCVVSPTGISGSIGKRGMPDDDDDVCEVSPPGRIGRIGGRGGDLKHLTPEEKRAHHNALERKRRDFLKESFKALRKTIPGLHRGETHKAPSRARVLEKSLVHIAVLKRKYGNCQIDVEGLEKQNKMLRAKIRALEKAKGIKHCDTFTVSDDDDNSS